MPTPVLYIYHKCSTCKSALLFLTNRLKDLTIKEITETPPTLSALQRMLHFQNGNLRKLFNTSGNLYKEMGLSEKLPNMTEKEALTLLKRNGMLVKRPFFLADNFGLVGFQPKIWEETLGVSLF